MTSSSHTIIRSDRSDFRAWATALRELAASNLDNKMSAGAVGVGVTD